MLVLLYRLDVLQIAGAHNERGRGFCLLALLQYVNAFRRLAVRLSGGDAGMRLRTQILQMQLFQHGLGGGSEIDFVIIQLVR